MIWPKAGIADAAGGWTIAAEFLEDVKDCCDDEDGGPSLEVIEQVLLAYPVTDTIAKVTGFPSLRNSDG